MGYEFSEVRLLKQHLVELNKIAHQVQMKVAQRIAQLAIRKVKKLTPVDTGNLRNNWKYYVLNKGDTIYIHIYNQTEYASFVENGHRIVVAGQTVGWVEGRFMLKLTMNDMQKIAPNMWKREIEKEMKRTFGD
ncbi:HK97 gp10 family phage protein [Anoxybacteroides amylolyticum]|uniref:Bacteriophage HK97-gp10, tail-component family protein n=1 Tax=Anoxybacteroides amylolyticum TaxID=294699 RepID=A0A167TSB0_9BACL|nr:HK97 gp10 family phage protein [Anoxybacillus amylolyticus]ANB62120.1 bacteriophage HK97-gp10, tail-component family protein [Anoxybacillus amylolyticus]